MRRAGILLAAAALAAAGRDVGGSATLSPAAPVITEPAQDGQVISAYDVHMVAGPFSGAPGENHVCSDWEIRTDGSGTLVWTAPCVTGALKVHIHLGDGEFVNLLAGRHQLADGSFYRLRVRFLGDAPPAGTDWSPWAERPFSTFPATGMQPLVLSDVSSIPSPRWTDALGEQVRLPGGSPPAILRLEAAGVGEVLRLSGADGGANAVDNPPPSAAHGALRVLLTAGGAPVSVPASVLAFTDGSGVDREVVLPETSVVNGHTVAWWVAEGGASFSDPTGGSPGAAPDFTTPVAEPTVPWAVRQAGFRVDRVATGFQLPVNVAFLPNPGGEPSDPYYYVTELYGAIKVVSRSGAVSDYATNLLDFDPLGTFPGSGEKGLTGIAVDPASGDVFVGSLFGVAADPNFHFPEVVRLHSTDGGSTAASRAPILHLPDEPLGPSHQTSNVSVGPDGKLYVHIGDGQLVTPAQDLTSARGKILRMELDGSAPSDNPFFDAADGITAKDYVFAYGFRNPFGGAWREADGAHWEVENGPSIDRLAKVVAGRNYLWDGTDPSMQNYAAYTWVPSHAPVNIAFVQLSTFSGSGFPSERLNHAFVTESGPTYAPGPQELGKRVVELVLDGAGNLISGPIPLVEYVGAGRGTATALCAGPDGLYFADLYKDFGASSPTDRGASIFRIRWTGVADFSSETPAGPAPLAVSFHDTSSVPTASAWHWEFGDGASSDEQEPTHVYDAPGTYDVRLTVTGSGGQTARQKPAFVAVEPAGRNVVRGEALRPVPRVLPPRP